MNKAIIIGSLISVLALAGCAKPPSKIAATAVASSEYSGLSCKRLSATLRDTDQKLTDAETKQRNKVATDAATVFLVLIPVSSMAGDYEAEVAQYKGEKKAIERAMSKKGC